MARKGTHKGVVFLVFASIFLFTCFLPFSFAEELEDSLDEDVPSSKPEPTAVIFPKGYKSVPYEPSVPESALFVETFQGDWKSKWVLSRDPKYSGEFAVGPGGNPAIPGDQGLIVTRKARHYGIAAPAKTGPLDDKTLVVQYEVRLDEGLECGGAYVKLLLEQVSDLASLNGDTPYSIMFGPDKCGITDKVHFIFQHRNPVTGKLEEKHLRNAPSVNTDSKTHLYTLIVNNKNSSYQILIDNKEVRAGSLLEDFEPPVNPPKEIDDPNDKKPADWVDNPKIPDPNAKKPDDWDESEPKEIPDPDAVKPEGWLDDEPERIPDPNARKPEDWDDEEDGEWEPPMIPNPKCEEMGCGEWKPPMIPNPHYRGKWKAPLIDNPNYKGPWKPRKIPNPDYYEDLHPVVESIGGIAIEIWTMNQGIVFDNFLVDFNVENAAKLAKETFEIKHKHEVATEEKELKRLSSKKGTKEKILDIAETIITKIETLLEPLERIAVSVGLGPVLDKMVDLGINRPILLVALIPPVFVLLFLGLSSGSKDKKKQKRSSKKDEGEATENKEEVRGSETTSEGLRRRHVPKE
ncbi:Calnexin [Galdieria sulphuraria]|uniref:Calnexin n=1 Tax=Galdieria sulphuraria TaxID=130081 RepID=M2Y4I7_GALSU|nr:calnexin [Galdieria sulphuraria]EME30848.1 calnexin [Galdieria sulphuraria]GJD08210.1 Calnexin [Galdieria sulphuraria]|eukprot:XP_005707368.1 calnexin [Galdieria sulphuraria]